MAGKKKKKKKLHNGHIFLLTLTLTIAVGSAALFGFWAFFGAGRPSRKIRDTEKAQTVSAPAAETAADAAAAGGADTAPETDSGQVSETDGSGESTSRYGELLADEERCRRENVFAKETKNPDEISLVFAGDILFDDTYAPMAMMRQRGRGIEGGIAAELLDEMRDADICMVNNEFPYTDRGAPLPDKTFTFRARPEYANYLTDMGVDIVSLANNHASDYGEVSLTDTLDILDGMDMRHVGAGRNLAEASRPVYFIANDKKIAIVAATQIERMDNPSTRGATEATAGVFRCRDVGMLLQAVREARENSDFVIVFVHWGTESTNEIDWLQKEQAPQIAEAGADLIIGSHPHVLQPVGYCGDVPVVYSLGNFLFNSKPLDSCLVKAVLDDNGLKSLQFIPARQENCTVSLSTGTERERILSYMREISPEAVLDENGFLSRAG